CVDAVLNAPAQPAGGLAQLGHRVAVTVLTGVAVRHPYIAAADDDRIGDRDLVSGCVDHFDQVAGGGAQLGDRAVLVVPHPDVGAVAGDRVRVVELVRVGGLDDPDQRPGRGVQLGHRIALEIGQPDVRAVGGDRGRI